LGVPLSGPVTAAGKRAAILTAGAAVLLMIAGCSLVRSSPANTVTHDGGKLQPGTGCSLAVRRPGRASVVLA